MENLMEKPWFEKYRPSLMEEVVFESKEVEDKIKSFISTG